jgi:hemerythrin
MAKTKTITMTKKAFTAEHKKLISLLNLGKKLVAEAKEQTAEMKKYAKKQKKTK